jgi:hypothetical protein
MATATLVEPTMTEGAVMVTAQTKQLRPELEQIVDDIFGLRALALATGFMTYKSQRDLLAQLSPKDQAAVGRALHLREKQSAQKV